MPLGWTPPTRVREIAAPNLAIEIRDDGHGGATAERGLRGPPIVVAAQRRRPECVELHVVAIRGATWMGTG